MKDKTTNRMNNCKKCIKMLSYFLVCSLLITLIFVIPGCSAKVEKTKAKPLPVKAVTVTEQPYSDEVTYFGTIEARDIKKYSFLKGGRLAGVPAVIGMKVSKGTVLATLDTEDYMLSQADSAVTYETAKSAFDFASSHYRDMQKLYEAGAASENDLNMALQQKNEASAKLSAASSNYSNNNNTMKNTVLKSDIEGIVAAVSFAAGETIGAGVPVVTVSSGKQKAVIGVSIEDIEKIKQGTEVSLTASKTVGEAVAEGSVVKGVVKNIGKLPDMATRTYMVEIEIPENKFVLGTFVNIDIPIGEENGILVPIASILDEGETYVYVVGKGSRAEKRQVEIVKTIEMNAVVTGLSSGDKLITEGMKNLEDGQPVKPKA